MSTINPDFLFHIPIPTLPPAYKDDDVTAEFNEIILDGLIQRFATTESAREASFWESRKASILSDIYTHSLPQISWHKEPEKMSKVLLTNQLPDLALLSLKELLAAVVQSIFLQKFEHLEKIDLALVNRYCKLSNVERPPIDLFLQKYQLKEALKERDCCLLQSIETLQDPIHQAQCLNEYLDRGIVLENLDFGVYETTSAMKLLTLFSKKPDGIKVINLDLISKRFDRVLTQTLISHVVAFKDLEFLDLSRHDYLTDEDLKQIAKLTNLKHVKLSCCELITDTGLEYLSQLPRLQTLIINQCKKITDMGLRNLSTTESLKELDVSSCSQVTIKGLGHLAELPHLHKLFIVNCTGVTDEGFKMLSQIHTLTEINASVNKNISDDGMASLSTLPRLQILKLLACPQVTGTGLQSLSSSTSLKELHLGSLADITDNGLAHLTSLTTLQTLVLNSCHEVTDNGLKLLSKSASLREFKATGCPGFTTKGLEYLFRTKRTLVNCTGVKEGAFTLETGIDSLPPLPLPSLSALHG